MTNLQIIYVSLGAFGVLLIIFVILAYGRNRKNNPRDVRMASSARAALLIALQPHRVDELVYQLKTITPAARKKLSVQWQIIEIKHELTILAIEVDEVKKYLLGNTTLNVTLQNTNELQVTNASREFAFFSERVDHIRAKYLALEKRITGLE